MQSGVAPARVAQAFFIWVSVFNLFVVSVFWSFMADLFRNEQARRLYGFIAAGGSTGALAGPLVTATLAPSLGPASLLPVSAVLLCASVVCIHRLAEWSTHNPAERRSPPENVEEPLGGNIFSGVTLALQSPYLIGICIYVMLGTLLGTFLYFHQANIMAVDVPSPGERTALFAKIDFAVNALTLFCQLFVVGRLVGRFGVGLALILRHRLVPDARRAGRVPGDPPRRRICDRAASPRNAVHCAEPRRKIQIEEHHRHRHFPRRRRGQRLAVRRFQDAGVGLLRHRVHRRADRAAVGGYRLDAGTHPG
jgi:MFS family permease